MTLANYNKELKVIKKLRLRMDSDRLVNQLINWKNYMLAINQVFQEQTVENQSYISLSYFGDIPVKIAKIIKTSTQSIVSFKS